MYAFFDSTTDFFGIFRATVRILCGALLVLLVACGPSRQERCRDECLTRTILCHNVLSEKEVKDRFFVCAPEICYEACDARAAEVDANQRARSQQYARDLEFFRVLERQ